MSTPSSDTPAGGGRRRLILIVVGVLAAVGALVLAAALLTGGDDADRATPGSPSGHTGEGPVAMTQGMGTAPTTFATPSGTPTALTVTNPDGKQIATAPLEAYPASRGLNFSPDRGRAGWWEQGRYGAPAQKEQSVISAHATWEGQPDVFHDLGTAKVGATVTIRFSSGSEARYRVTAVTFAPKKDVVNDKTDVGARVWNDKSLSVITCDVDSGTRADGHLTGNTVLLTQRIS